MKAALLAMMMLVTAAIVASQTTSTPPVNTGSIRGLVSRLGTTDGIADVSVTIRANGRGATGGPFTLKTDATGNFTINEVPSGSWLITAERDGYSPSGGTPVEQALVTVAVQTRSSVALHLVATGTIRGRITDSNGNPLAGISVEPVLPGYDTSGRRTWLTKTTGPRGATTDDRGEYRVYSCLPGDYYVRVVQLGRGNSSQINVVAYFPGSADPALATPVTVREGADTTADVVVAPLVARKVSGSIHVDRTAIGALNVILLATLRDRRIPAEPLRLSIRINGSDGDFSFSGVPLGSYEITAEAGSPATFTGGLTLDVGERDISGIALSLHPTANLKAHVTHAANAPSNPAGNLPFTLVSKSTGSSHYPPAPDASGNLNIPNMQDGLFIFRSGPLSTGLVVSDIQQGLQSVIETGLNIGGDSPLPLEITVSAGTGSVQGNTELPAGASAANAVLVPALEHRQNTLLYRSVRTDASGHFTFNGVPPGRYTVFAWEVGTSLNASQLVSAAINAEFLAQYETLGTGLTVNSGPTIISSKVSLIRNLVFPPIPLSNISAPIAKTPNEPAGAVLEGIVTISGKTDPVAGANVTASGPKSLSTMSDASGRFRIAGLPAGTYRIGAQRDGYLSMLADSVLPIRATADQHIDGIVVNLRLGGAINGRLLGLDGKPLAGTPVVAGSTAPYDTATYPKNAYTNDRGEYRIFGLEPGTYIVGVNSGQTNVRNALGAYVRTYFPNTIDLFRAVPVDVAEGANVTGIDFTVQQVPTVRISGKVINTLAPPSTSSAATPADIYLIPQERSPLDTGALPNSRIRAQADGTFSITNVLPGTYYVVADGTGTGNGSITERAKAWATVRVGAQDLTDVNLTIQRGMRLTGQMVGGDIRTPSVRFGTLRLIASGAPVNVQAEQMLSQTAVIDSAGAFTISNVPAGTYRFVTQNMRNIYISDVRVGTASVLRNGLTVDGNTAVEGLVVSVGGVGTLVGTVLNAQGSGVSSATVVLMPDLERSGDSTLFKTATSSASGRFTIVDVPPGNYTALAFQGFSVDPARSVPLLEEFATSGQAVTVTPDSGTNVTITLIPRSIP